MNPTGENSDCQDTNPKQIGYWNIGDTVFVAMGGKDLVEGKVIHIFEWCSETQYVIEIDTHIDPVLEVRDWLTTSDDRSKPLFFWRRFSEIL